MLESLDFVVIVSSSFHFGSCVILINGVGQFVWSLSLLCLVILFDHMHRLLPVYSLHFILYLFFPRLFQSSPAVTHFKLSSLFDHIFIFFSQNMTVSLHATYPSHPIQRLLPLYPTCPSIPRCFFHLIASTHIAWINALSALFKITISFSLKHHVLLPCN